MSRTYPLDGRRHGFALVISLALISFLLILIVTLTSVVRLENQSSESLNDEILAKQNAVLGMRIALGELQSNLGPDQRISANADLMNDSDSSKRYTTGVWSSADVSIGGIPYTKGQQIAWLASDAIIDGVPVQDYNQNAADTTSGVLLLGTGSVAGTRNNPGDVDDLVYVNTSNTEIENEDGEPIGRYAWWVGDESTKARINTEDGIEQVGGLEEKYRTVIASSSFGRSVPFALAGLNSQALIDALDDSPGKLTDLTQIDLLTADGDVTDDGQYFHHLTPHSMGVLADARNGGLKKDLSLAFEMTDRDFNDSEFAGSHPLAYDPWSFAPHQVASVFLFAEPGNGYGLPEQEGPSFTGAGNGPTWHLLRDYYTIYHRMLNPMSNPTLDAQTLAPNWNHDFEDYDFSNHTNDTGANYGSNPNQQGAFQPAFLYSGGPSFHFSGSRGNVNGGGSFGSRVNETVIDYTLSSNNNPLDLDIAGDPLRTRLGTQSFDIPTADFRLPTLVEGNYMPYLRRFVAETGFWFDDSKAASGLNPDYGQKNANGNTINYTGLVDDLYRINTRVRTAYVFHNPYNVSIRHNKMAVLVTGPTINYDLYELDSATPLQGPVFTVTAEEPVLDSKGDPTGDFTPTEIEVSSGGVDFVNASDGAERQGLGNKAFVEAGTLAPGAVVKHSGRSVQSSDTSATPTLDDFTNADWGNIWNLNEQSSIGAIMPSGEATQLTAVARPGSLDQWLTNQRKDSSGRFVHSFTRLHFSLSMQDDAATDPGDSDPASIWPTAYSFNSISVLPGAGYSAAGSDERVAGTHRSPQPGSAIGSFEYGTPNYPWSISNNVTVGDHVSRNAAFGMGAYDFQLRPPGMISPGGEQRSEVATPYPAFVMTNPLAPIKDNKNVFYPDETRDSINRNGYPGFSPGWEYTFGPGWGFGGGTDYKPWGDSDGNTRINSGRITDPIFIELPTSPVLSIGKLQHANITLHDHMPALAIGNSFASPFIQRDRVYEINQNRYGRERMFYDISYLMNEALWDEYFFSSYSIPYDNGSGDDYDEVSNSVKDTFDLAFDPSLAQNTPLPNPRMELHLGGGEFLADVENKLFDSRGDPLPSVSPGNSKDASFYRAAENLMVKGGFNVNSTSVEAWETVLFGAHEMAIYTAGNNSPEAVLPASEVSFLRISQPNAGITSDPDVNDTLGWKGFRSLDRSQISALASNIVAEIRSRSNNPSDPNLPSSPFLSLSDFVNRRISNDSYGLSGVLQAAIDRTSSLNSSFETATYDISESITNNEATNGFAFRDASNLLDANGNPASSASSMPTYLLQADILQAIGSFLAVRGDTFRIRAFGEHGDPDRPELAKKAWCEAIVQRVPEQVGTGTILNPTDVDYWSDLDSSNNIKTFGRKFVVIDFRWLSEDEV
ncbi:MAG: hypothetical protein ACPGN3_08855 [Opitutales bacterium]